MKTELLINGKWVNVLIEDVTDRFGTPITVYIESQDIDAITDHREWYVNWEEMSGYRTEKTLRLGGKIRLTGE